MQWRMLRSEDPDNCLCTTQPEIEEEALKSFLAICAAMVLVLTGPAQTSPLRQPRCTYPKAHLEKLHCTRR